MVGDFAPSKVALTGTHQPIAAELGAGADDLLDRVKEVLLDGDLPPRPDREHARLGADGAQLGAGRVRAKARDEVISKLRATDMLRWDLCQRLIARLI